MQNRGHESTQQIRITLRKIYPYDRSLKIHGNLLEILQSDSDQIYTCPNGSGVMWEENSTQRALLRYKIKWTKKLKC